MAQKSFKEIANYTGGFKDRSHWERQSESRWAHKAISNIENFLTGVKWNDLGGSQEVEALRKQLEAKLNQTNVDVSAAEKAIGGWKDQLTGQKQDLLDQLSGVQTTFDSERASVSDALRAAEAGWEDNVAAWNQQGADWTQQFSQQQREHETQLAEYLDEQRGAFESQQAIWGKQSAEDRSAWETQSAQDRQDYATQIGAYDLRSKEEKAAWDERWQISQEEWDKKSEQEKADWSQQYETAKAEQQQRHATQMEELKSTFAQQQEDFRLAAQQERKTLESQLGTQYTEQWNKQQQDLTSQYEGLLSQATTEAEAARLTQARDFEQRQLDQQAAWNEQAQALATQDELYGTRLDELKTGLGLQTDMYSRLKEQSAEERGILGQQLGALGTQFSSDLGSLGSQLGSDISSLGQSSEAARSQLGTQLGSQISTLGQTSEAARSQLGAELGSQISTLGQTGETEREFIKGDIAEIQSNFDTTTRDAAAERNSLKDAVRRSEEIAIQAQERTRVAASYGSQGSPTNQQVQGVRTINELKPAGQMGMGTGGAFNRKGLRIKNLNI
tara:strand:+ start:202 stop:1878 length:1677 start_codon:yes stop_codon:yes gene_type:complete